MLDDDVSEYTLEVGRHVRHEPETVSAWIGPLASPMNRFGSTSGGDRANPTLEMRPDAG
jgi:hypothetical protein